MRMRLSARTGAPAALVVKSVSVLDPRAGVDGLHDVLVRDGQIAELAAPGRSTRST